MASQSVMKGHGASQSIEAGVIGVATIAAVVISVATSALVIGPTSIARTSVGEFAAGLQLHSRTNRWHCVERFAITTQRQAKILLLSRGFDETGPIYHVRYQERVAFRVRARSR